jgi:hypothetical protein
VRREAQLPALPQCFERLRFVGVVVQTCRFPVATSPYLDELDLDLDARMSRSTAQPNRHDHAVAGVDELQRLE